ncbi:MAG TPA: proteasome assembly chaperone family protein [Nitrosopumilaceae archaeon]|nr:proteasome assembly chaperone family protein [Nitrosopumilaceae archaeon]
MKMLYHFFRIIILHNSLISQTDDNKSKKLEKIPKLPSMLFVGIPGPGLIGILALNYVIHSFKMDIVEEIEHSDLSNIIFIDNGEIYGPVRIYKKNALYVVVSDVPIDYVLAEDFTESIIDFSKKNKIAVIVFLGGINKADRNLENLKTYGLVTDEKLDKVLYENEIPKFLSGMIAGPDATILTKLKNSPVPTIVLFTECNLFFPDPEAAIHSINTISRILKTEIDITEFKKQIDFLRLQSRQLMEDTLTILNPEKTKPAIPAPQIYK